MSDTGKRILKSHHFRALALLSFFALLAFWVYFDRRLVLDDWAQISAIALMGSQP